MSREKRILCFGDSNTWGCKPLTIVDGTPLAGTRFSDEERWTGILAQNPDYTIIEEGLGGRTTAFPDPAQPWLTGINYFEACVLSHDPLDLLIIMLGTNDLKTHVCNSTDASAMAVMRMVKMGLNVVSKPFKVLIVAPTAIKPERLQRAPRVFDQTSIENSRRFGEVYRQQAELNGYAFLDAAEFAEPSDIDQVHWDAAGHAAFAKAVEEKLKEIFKNDS